MVGEDFQYTEKDKFKIYKQNLEQYCVGIDNFKRKLKIKIIILIAITIYIALVSFVMKFHINTLLETSETSDVTINSVYEDYFSVEEKTNTAIVNFAALIRDYGTWLIIIPMFFIGKNLGQNKYVIDIAKEARRDLNKRFFEEKIVYIESCLLDEDYKKQFKNRFLKLSKRYMLVSTMEDRYKILNEPDIKIYQGDPIKMKIVSTLNTGIVLELKILEREEYDVSDKALDWDEEEKLNRFIRRKSVIWSARCIKLPCIAIKHKEKEFCYIAADVFYNGIALYKNEREMNIICRRVMLEVKKYIDNYDTIEKSTIEEAIDIVKNVIKRNIRDLDITKIDYDYIIKKNEWD